MPKTMRPISDREVEVWDRIMKQKCFTLEKVEKLVRSGGSEAEAMFSHINSCNLCLERLSIVAQTLGERDRARERAGQQHA